MKLEWKTNFSDPYKYDHDPLRHHGEDLPDALHRERQFWDSYIKGRPRATETYTVEQLEAMGMHGLYEEVSS